MKKEDLSNIANELDVGMPNVIITNETFGFNKTKVQTEISNKRNTTKNDGFEPKQKNENYYQPNPLVSHELPQGVTLEFYGNKKSGGKYEVGNERLTMEQYQNLLEQIKPYSQAQIEERQDESYDEEEKSEGI